MTLLRRRESHPALMNLTDSPVHRYIRMRGSGNGADAADGAHPNRTTGAFGVPIAPRLSGRPAAGQHTRERRL